MSTLRALADRTLASIGWTAVGDRPAPDKFVLIAAPHTSNWDLGLMLLLALHFDLDISWIGKHTLFEPPLGWLMRRLGGIAVDRRSKNDVVKLLADVFAKADKLCLAVPVEGTRSRTEHWKSGFYWIAKTAGVPIVLGVLDYGKKEGGFGPTIWPSDDLKADMDKIREFYKGRTGLYPDEFGPVRLRDEEGDGSSAT